MFMIAIWNLLMELSCLTWMCSVFGKILGRYCLACSFLSSITPKEQIVNLELPNLYFLIMVIQSVLFPICLDCHFTWNIKTAKEGLT